MVFSLASLCFSLWRWNTYGMLCSKTIINIGPACGEWNEPSSQIFTFSRFPHSFFVFCLQTSTRYRKGDSMDSISAPNSDGGERPSKRIRTPTRPYKAGPANAANDSLSQEEERMLAQAIANSRKDCGREPLMLSSIPFGPTFYPTVEEFSVDPLTYLETIRSEAEKYGEFWHDCIIVTPTAPTKTSPSSDAIVPLTLIYALKVFAKSCLQKVS